MTGKRLAPDQAPEACRTIGRTEQNFIATNEYNDSVRNRVNSMPHGTETDRNRNRAGQKTNYLKQRAIRVCSAPKLLDGIRETALMAAVITTDQ